MDFPEAYQKLKELAGDNYFALDFSLARHSTGRIELKITAYVIVDNECIMERGTTYESTIRAISLKLHRGSEDELLTESPCFVPLAEDRQST